MNIEKPEIKRKDGATTIDVVVNLPHGVVMRTSTKIATESQKLLEDVKPHEGSPRKAYFVDLQHGDLECTSCINLLTLAIENGRRMKVKVDGEDEIAELIALRLYSALTSGDSYNLDFYRYG